MKARVVRSRVTGEVRERYLAAWTELSGALYTMGVRTSLLVADDDPQTHIEIAWFESGYEAALADDRIVRLDAELTAAADSREGDQSLFRSVF